MKSLKSKILALFTIACMFTGAVGVYADDYGSSTQNQVTYQVDFGQGSWSVNGNTVKAATGDGDGLTILTGVKAISKDTVITLTDFNQDTMEVRVSGGNDFSVALNVVDGKTSLAARKTEGVYPGPENTLTFTVGMKSSGGIDPSDPSQGTEGMIESSLIVTGSIDMYINDSNMKNYKDVNSKADSVKYTHKETEKTVTFRVANFINERYTKIIINGTDYAKSLPDPTTVEGREAMLNALQDQIYVYTFTVPYNYEYKITAEKAEVSGDSPYSLIGNFLWSYDEENPDGSPVPKDQYIGNGTMELLNIFYDGKDYEPGSEFPSWIVWGQNEHGGSAVLPADAEVTVKMIPDYGYQLMNLSINDQEFKPQDEQSVFTFTVKKGNFHLGAKFEETSNLVTSSSDVVKDGSVTLNGNVINQGTVIVNVKDGTGTEDFENELPENLNGYHVNSVVDIGMDQVWYKGTDTAYWSKPITDLGGNSATVTITAPTGQTDIQVMHERHDGTYEVLKGTEYDSETGELTFTTDSFSRFALAYDIKSFDENKNQILTTISNIRTENDSDAASKLITEAEAAVKALTYDVTKTPEANNEAVNSIFTKLTQDLEAQQIKEAKAVFETYKNDRISYINSLGVYDDPLNVAPLISGATIGLEILAYDETKSLSANQEAVDAIVSDLETMIRNARLAEYDLKIPSESEIKSIVNITNSANNTLNADVKIQVDDCSENAPVFISLKAEPEDTQQVSAARDLLTESLKTYQAGMFLELNLEQYSKLGVYQGRITELEKDVTITFRLPENLINKNPNVIREYVVGRIHEYENGTTEVKLLETTFDKATSTLSTGSNRFSTYVIMYRDIPKSVPDTSDHSNTALWMAVLMLSGIVAAGTVVFRRKRS